jgi:hypothetical protein
MWALYPREFSRGPNATRTYNVLGDIYPYDPRRLLTPADIAMIPIWQAWTESKILPEAGGLFDQPAIVEEAVNWMSRRAADLRAYYKRGR